MQTLHEKGILDYTGAAVSWACAIHCLAMPFLITALPLFGLSFLADELTELIFISVSILIALLTFLSAINKHHKIQPLLFFIFGILILLSSHFFFEDELFWKFLTVLLGAISITTAHLLNHFHSKSCKVCSEEESEKPIHSVKTTVY